jgi:hypothetical protein
MVAYNPKQTSYPNTTAGAGTRPRQPGNLSLLVSRGLAAGTAAIPGRVVDFGIGAARSGLDGAPSSGAGRGSGVSGGGSGGATANPLSALKATELDTALKQLQAQFGQTRSALGTQLTQENANEKFAYDQNDWAQSDALNELASQYASRGMARSGQYAKAVADTMTRLGEERNQIIAQYDMAHQGIMARLGWATDPKTGAIVFHPITGDQAVDDAAQDNTGGTLVQEQGSEWAKQQAEIQARYAMAGLHG